RPRPPPPARRARGGRPPPRLVLVVDAAPDLPPVTGHASQLQQVILNLLTNAIDATPPGGRVEAATRAVGRGQVAIEVRDTGKGITADERRHIFDPFFS